VTESGFQFTDIFFPRSFWYKIRKVVISIFVFLVLFGFMVYLLLPNHVYGKVMEPLQPFLSFFCLHQGYGVFAPSPSTRNSHMVALVFYDDGTSRLYALPRLERISMLQKLYKERYRKFLEDNLPNKNNAHIVNDVARFVARQCDVFKGKDRNGPANRPKVVMLINMWSEVPPIHVHKPSPLHFNMNVLCSYPVKSEDLE